MLSLTKRVGHMMFLGNSAKCSSADRLGVTELERSANDDSLCIVEKMDTESAGMPEKRSSSGVPFPFSDTPGSCWFNNDPFRFPKSLFFGKGRNAEFEPISKYSSAGETSSL